MEPELDISFVPPSPSRAAFPNRLPSSHCGFAGSGAPTAAHPTHPPTPTQPLKMSINATSSRARLFDVLLNDEQCAAFADARRVCQSRVPPRLRRFVAVLGSIGFRLLDFTSPAGRNLRSCKRCPLTVAPLRWAPLQERCATPARVEVTGRGSKGRLACGSCESCGRCPISRFFPHAGLQDTPGSAGALHAHRGAGPCITRDAPV